MPPDSPWDSTTSMATRREFLAGASAAWLTTGIASTLAARKTPRLVSAARLGQTDGGVVWGADRLAAFKLPARGHAPVRLTGGRVLVMGRRPGLFASIVDPDDPAAASTFESAGNNRFSGHAALAPDGSTLVTGEF